MGGVYSLLGRLSHSIWSWRVFLHLRRDSFSLQYVTLRLFQQKIKVIGQPLLCGWHRLFDIGLRFDSWCLKIFLKFGFRNQYLFWRFILELCLAFFFLKFWGRTRWLVHVIGLGHSLVNLLLVAHANLNAYFRIWWAIREWILNALLMCIC